jgi:Protein of unknown function (DUF993)
VSAVIVLPGTSDALAVHDAGLASSRPPAVSRRAFAAAHVAAFPDGSIDWDATLGFRRHLWGLGLGVADAMDTAQRGMGLTWADTRELVQRSAAEARAVDGRIACGAGTDQLAGDRVHTTAEIRAAYEEQLDLVEEAGAQVVLMASRALAARRGGADEYLDLYGRLLRRAKEPVILHWLGDMFDPNLYGYWGSDDLAEAADTVVALIARADGKVDGVKLSVLDVDVELSVRSRLPEGVRLYTGDDLNYPDLILGDDDGYSDALLGAFAAVATPAAAALAALDAGDLVGYADLMGATLPLSRTLFEPPTYEYKAGVAFVAWLNGFQPHFAMIEGFERRRSVEHLVRLFQRAVDARALLHPELAVSRMSELLGARAAGA